MKRLIKAANMKNRKSIDQLTEEEIKALPDRITLVTRTPGASKYVSKFQVVTKDKLANPDECFVIDSYWGYAFGHDVYIATRGEIAEEEKKEIENIKNKYDKYRQYARMVW